MQRFLNDFRSSGATNRYVRAELPRLPFESNTFDLALVSHLLFLYSEQMNADLHLSSILELLRVAKEVRIFPLTDLTGHSSKHLAPVVSALNKKDIECKVVEVGYEFQRGANQMLLASLGENETLMHRSERLLE